MDAIGLEGSPEGLECSSMSHFQCYIGPAPRTLRHQESLNHHRRITSACPTMAPV